MNFLRGISLTHRWLGIIFCLFFAMWFLTGWVMHFVQFPALSVQEKFAGLSPLQVDAIKVSPSAAERIAHADKPYSRVRLIMRGERLQYIFESGKHRIGIFADTGEPANKIIPAEAIKLASIHARNRGLNISHISYAELEDYDQWTVSNGLDPHRPLYRICLNDEPGTELYVSSTTGEIVRDTTRVERGWNYAGSVLHWIYPTVLRKHWAVWDMVVWWLSAIALISAITGTWLGIARIRWKKGVPFSPFKRIDFWHHALGLSCATFILTYVFSGWLSMDHGLLFSTSDISPQEQTLLSGGELNLQHVDAINLQQAQGAKEIDFLSLNNTAYVRAKSDYNHQRLFNESGWNAGFFDESFFTANATKLSTKCDDLSVLATDDNYPATSDTQGSPVFRLSCDDQVHTWFHIDSATGQLIEKLDDSRRWYRWLFSGLHTLDFHWLLANAGLRSLLVSIFCCTGFIFSITGVVIGWRRLRRLTR